MKQSNEVHDLKKCCIKRVCLMLTAMLCTLCLSGCVPLSVNLQRTDQSVILPMPEEKEIIAAIGDSQNAIRQDVTLYLISEEQQLFPVRCNVEVSEGKSLVTETIKALLVTPDLSDAQNPFPKGTSLLNVERSGNVVVVDLSIDALNVESDRQLLWMRSALSASLTGMDGIRYVNMLIAGHSEALMNMPAGAASGASVNLSAYAARLIAEHELLEHHTEENTSIERNAVLYYPSKDGSCIIPMVRTIRIQGDDFITPLLNALAQPLEEDWVVSPIPRLSAAWTQPPQIVEGADGRKWVKLAFDTNLIAMLERENLSPWQVYASLTYTLTGFVPEVEGLMIQLGDGQLTRTERNGQELFFEDGAMTRNDYPDAVGRKVLIYMTSIHGGLMELARPLDQKSADSPRAILNELFKGVQPWEKEAARVMPDGVSIDDVLGIRLADGEAIVNLSSHFYRCCQGLNPQQEKHLIYAIVNSLTTLPEVSAVRFQIEGESVDYLIHDVFLRGALMRNIGIIK